jgi:hypothetical protein
MYKYKPKLNYFDNIKCRTTTRNKFKQILQMRHADKYLPHHALSSRTLRKECFKINGTLPEKSLENKMFGVKHTSSLFEQDVQ